MLLRIVFSYGVGNYYIIIGYNYCSGISVTTNYITYPFGINIY
jgi:hypothetical protein